MNMIKIGYKSIGSGYIVSNIVNENSTIVDHVTKKIREEILKENIKNGERLIQEEWAKKLNVSRMPVREAFNKLEMEGLVEIIPRKGAVVTSITENDIEEIYSMRAFLEGQAVEKALPYLTKQDKSDLKNILEKMEALNISDDTNAEYTELNSSFHEILRKDCPWPRLKKMVENLGISPIAPNLLKDYYPETQKEHRNIYKAVIRNNPEELRSAIEYHILRTKNNLIEYMAILNK